MSDFLFTRDIQAVRQLAQPLKDLMPEPESVKVIEYSGSWGALAVSLGPYNGFEPYEDDTYICVVIGGPVLYWRDNYFLTDSLQSTAATQAILQHWQSGNADWSEDLSGPFVIFIVNKKTGEVLCLTDLMMFIPVYIYSNEIALCLGTHVDAVADISKQKQNIDEVSVADFVLHSIVTYPHTIYTNLYQLAAATEHKWMRINSQIAGERVSYWEPLEFNPYKKINEAAINLRVGISNYIERITERMNDIGQFISAGEDSRSIAGMLPKRLKRHAYIFVDSKNREFKLAELVAKAYSLNFNYTLRTPTHYLDILPMASKLVGSGQQYANAHTLIFAKKSGADNNLAVFGGFLSDTLIKGHYVKKNKIYSKLSFLPEFFIKGQHRCISNDSLVFSTEVLKEINNRRINHYKYISCFRKESTFEWFNVWPITMHSDFPNISVNRRLFASYEVFTSKDVVKIAAAVPTRWKLNRKLFHKTFKPALELSMWVKHADGRLPYFPWYVNSFLQMPRWSEVIFNQVFKINVNDGPWGDWRQVINNSAWELSVKKYSKNIEKFSFFKDSINPLVFLHSNKLNQEQKVNLMQIICLKEGLQSCDNTEIEEN